MLLTTKPETLPIIKLNFPQNVPFKLLSCCCTFVPFTDSQKKSPSVDDVAFLEYDAV